MTLDQMWAEFQNRYQKQVQAEPVLYTIDEMINYWSKRSDTKSKRILAYWQSQKI